MGLRERETKVEEQAAVASLRRALVVGRFGVAELAVT
jgi:hypothetical protein